MILVGNQRGGAADLARHLMKSENERVVVHNIRGFIASDLMGAFKESEAVAKGTRCKQHLYSLSLNPPKEAEVTPEMLTDAVERAEKSLGLTGQPRAIVFHTKNGRTHAHAVWSRIDLDHMRAIEMSFDRPKLQNLARDLYREYDWQLPRGFIRHEERNPLNYTLAEWQQSKRAGRDPKALKAIIQDCWLTSDSKSSFIAALRDNGFVLARGDKRGAVAVDHTGEAFPVARAVGITSKRLKERLGGLNDLPSREEGHRECAELLTAHLKDLQDDQRRIARERLDQAAENRKAAIAHQQMDAKRRHDKQVQRINAEQDAAKARLRTGWRGLVDRITGHKQRVNAENKNRIDAALMRAGEENAALSAAQKRARQKLQESTADIKDLHQDNIRALDADIARLDPESAPAPAPEADPKRQTVLDDFNAAAFAPPKPKPLKLPDTDAVLVELSDKKASFDRTDILRALTRHSDNPQVLKEAVDQALKSPDLIKLDGDETQRYTTRDYRAHEDQLHASVDAMAASRGFGVSKPNIDRAMRDQNQIMRRDFGGALSAEQRAALGHVTGDVQLSSIVGLAGAGKSTLLKTAAQARERQGITVHGAALAGKAAEELQKASGIKSRTLAALETSWENDHTPISKGDVLVIDEAGMVGTRQLARVSTKINEIGAKLVLVGDPDQLQPIQAGTPMRDVVQRHGAARLTEIHRQREIWQKRATRDLADGDIARAVKAYQQRGHVMRGDDNNAAIAALVEAYTADIAANGNTATRLAFAHRRKDVHALNTAIRNSLRVKSEIPTPERTYTTENGKRAFAPGDRIVFSKNDRDLGVKNGMLGTVQGISASKLRVLLDSDDANAITFDPRDYKDFDHGYAVTIHKSQGATVDRSFVLATRSMDRHLSYVAMTRHKNDLNIFAGDQGWPETKREQKPAPVLEPKAKPDSAASDASDTARNRYIRDQKREAFKAKRTRTPTAQRKKRRSNNPSYSRDGPRLEQ